MKARLIRGVRRSPGRVLHVFLPVHVKGIDSVEIPKEIRPVTPEHVGVVPYEVNGDN